MIILTKILLMKNILKVLLSTGLSFFLLTSAIHIDSNNLNFTDGYSICEINCDDEGHYFSYHQCEKCIVKQTQADRQECFEITYQKNPQFYIYYNLNKNKTVINHSLYSRPPPQII